MSSLAILILTHNEEENIVPVVENAKKCTNEVIIIDSGSTDQTVALAKENCEVKSLQEKDESLESYYISLVGGGSNA